MTGGKNKTPPTTESTAQDGEVRDEATVPVVEVKMCTKCHSTRVHEPFYHKRGRKKYEKGHSTLHQHKSHVRFPSNIAYRPVQMEWPMSSPQRNSAQTQRPEPPAVRLCRVGVLLSQVPNGASVFTRFVPVCGDGLTYSIFKPRAFTNKRMWIE